ncbi:MAG: ribose-phosphate diphosphokinase [Methanomicrobiales archaeon]|nr:ribose-phosphate diphosphokinase [Methanomicrobiales archaeon]NYT20489.1 ribose-phosphate diphosphokinase [Methanomicrobiales archaeon]
MKVISTEYSQILAARIAREGGWDLVDVKFSRFPDGEHYLRTGVVDDEVVVVGSVVDSDSLVQLLLLIDACSGSSPVLLLPYMGYARQDKQFYPGEPLSARAVARALSSGVCRVFTVNIHDPGVLRHFTVPVENLSLAPEIGAYLGRSGYDDPLILAPDDGAVSFASMVAAAGNWDCDHLEKTRISGEEVRIEPKHLCADGRAVVIVDDIISTGSTLATAAGLLSAQGAKTVAAACVHGVFAGGAYARLIASGVEDVAASDTIEQACSVYSAATTVVSGIRGC